MGFQIELNSILRSDDDFVLSRGAINSFERPGSRIFFDDIPIWLTRNDWTALAEIGVREQTRTAGSVHGKFEVLHAYDTTEQAALTEIFRRMYASSDPYVYVLRTREAYETAKADGTLYDESLKNVGFIHASPADQLTRVANKYYTGTGDIVVLVVDRLRIDAIVKWEPANGGLYPHIYGPLNMDAVSWVVKLSPRPDHTFNIEPRELDARHALDAG